MIDINDLGLDFNGQPALSGINARIEPGKCVALLGANGSGKSSLLMLLTGLYRPSRGEIRVGAAHSPGQERDLRRQVGLLMQDADLQILGATVEEDLALGVRTGPGSGPSAWDLACRFALNGKWKTPVHQLSGGQKRKLCLAGMMLRQPQVVLYDEPFSGLDYPAILELRSLMQANAAQGTTQVVAAHDLEPLVGLATGCLVLQQGRLVYGGCLEEAMDLLPGFGVRPPCSWQTEKRLQPWA